MANSAVDVDAASVGGSWLSDKGFLGIAFNTFDSLYGIPSAEEEAVRIDLEQSRVDVKGGWTSLGGAVDEIKLRLAFNDYEHVELEGDEVGTRFTNDATEGRIELVHEPVGRWSGAFGLQFSDIEFAAIGAEAFVPPVDTTSYGLFLLERLDLAAWQLSFGGRIETQEHVPSGGLPNVDGDATSLSFAGVRTLGAGYAFVVNLASAERLPVAEELYSDGPHLATGALQIGDPALQKETSRHLDVGVRKQEGDLTWSVTAFTTGYDDFIYLADTGLVDPVDDLPVFAYVQQGADFVGVEAELFTPIADLGSGEVDMRVFADFVDGELDGGSDLPRMPPRRLGARFQYHDERVLVGIEATRYAEQDKVAAFETPTEGYSLVNADFRWRFNRRERNSARAVRERLEPHGRGGAQAHVVREGPRAAAGTEFRGRSAEPVLTDRRRRFSVRRRAAPSARVRARGSAEGLRRARSPARSAAARARRSGRGSGRDRGNAPRSTAADRG